MKTTKTRITALAVLVVLLLLPPITALGIHPAKTELVAEETKEYTGELWIVNTDNQEMTIKVYPQGALQEYITVDKSIIDFSPDMQTQGVKYHIQLPNILPPGTTTSYIVVEQEIKNADPSVISARILLKHRVSVLSAYPDKFIDVKVSTVEEENAINLISEIENKGKLDIQDVQTKFKVTDKDSNIHELETEKSGIKSKQDTLLRTSIGKEYFTPGEYQLSATTTYDELEVEVIKELRVGKPTIDITYFNPFFIANKINEYSLDLANRWNKKVENVYVDVEVKKDNQQIDQFRTKSVDIDAETSARINDYLDAREKNPGKYTFEMVVNFWNSYRMETKQFESELVTEKDFKELPNTLTGAGIANPPASKIPLTLSIAIFLLFGAMGGYWYWNRQNQASDEEDTKEKSI